MALASIDIDTTALARAAGVLGTTAARLEVELDLLVRHRLAEAERDLRAHTPRSVPQPGRPAAPHTHMADLWHSQTFGQAAGAVGDEASYTEFLFTGTRPHDIRPRSAGALHFFAGGTEVFTGEVHHPGTQASAPLVAALGRQVAAAEADLEALGVRTMAQIAAQISIPSR